MALPCAALAGLRRRVGGKKEGCSFLKKRTKKLLSVQVCASPATSYRWQGVRAKAFWFFFSKKNSFFLPFC
jgi:hypothetical protein